MGQVPGKTSYGIVGDGRVARHVAHYFNLLRIPYRQWCRRSSLEGSTNDPWDVFADTETILLLISDSAIEPWVESYRAGHASRSQRFVHFSGSLVSSLATGMHPLMTFTPGFYELSDYQVIPFICEDNGPRFQDVFPRLPNPSFRIPAEKKALYHALCVMSGNFTVLLWQKMFTDLEKCGVPTAAAIPYLERIARNLKQNPQSALTGPLARGDRATIQRNLDSLSGDRFQKVYESFVEALLP